MAEIGQPDHLEKEPGRQTDHLIFPQNSHKRYFNALSLGLGNTKYLINAEAQVT